ncbi:hypothetical protein [Streptomyces sp. NPDC059533]|uniref:hypothetical protein n=1 Tax=unclassified Streptomyces TaxID=2593676 RepID=UPI00369E8C44
MADDGGSHLHRGGRLRDARSAADLRRLAGQVTALTGLADGAEGAIGELNRALAHNDTARLVRPLTGTRATCGPRTPSSPSALTP